MTPDHARLVLRPVTLDDVGLMAANLVAGLATYRSFAPPGWEPPTAEHEAERIRPRVAGGAWGRLALDGDDVAGHVLFVPAVDLPDGAHLAALFVAEPWWGSGLASRLLGLAVAEMRHQGYRLARLYTPAGQARARRFYEREGWWALPDVVPEPGLGLDLVEYRLALRRAPPRTR